MERISLPPSHHELRHLFARQVQGEVLICSFDGKRVLLAEHSGALLSQALVAAAVTQLLGTAEGVTVGGVLAELGPLQAVLLIEADVVQGLAVAVRGRLRLPAHRCLRGKTTDHILKGAQVNAGTQKHSSLKVQTTVKVSDDSARSFKWSTITTANVLTRGLHGCRCASAVVLRLNAVFSPSGNQSEQKQRRRKRKHSRWWQREISFPHHPLSLEKG